MASNAILYEYERHSSLEKKQSSEELFLSKFNETKKEAAPCFFWGRIKNPHILARCLVTLSRIVQSSFSLSPFQLALLKDPIVTAGNQKIRFEGFSHCAGVYGRVDVLEDGQEGEFIESGTTNVDFNTPLITELSGIQRGDKLVLSVGRKELGFHKDGQSIIERKVPLPSKWIKGLTTVQQYFSESQFTVSLNKLQAIQLFRSIPIGNVKRDYYLIYRSGKYAFTPMKSKNTLCIGGIHRLKLITPLIPSINSLKIYIHENHQASNIVLNFGDINFNFSLSRNPWRGFSGEGAALEALIEDIPAKLIEAFDNYSFTNQIFNPFNLQSKHHLEPQRIEGLAAKLAAMGLLGFDLENNHYFYRRLPFNLNRILALNPRLKSAQKLVEENKVNIVSNKDGKIESRVAGSGVLHYVVISERMQKCTCLWYSKNQGERGVCKHILATKLLAKNQ